MKDDNESEIIIDDQRIIESKVLKMWQALVPIVFLMLMLAANIYYDTKFGKGILGGYSNQYILLIAGGIAAIIGFINKVSFRRMILEIYENLKSVLLAIFILLLVGALSGTWLVSGIIPAMAYYGLKVLSPIIFLPATVVITSIISVATGSSWTTIATVGIALIGIGTVLGISPGIIAGAVISGAYFGDKMSPLSDTTNLASAMAGSDLFSHIRYMTITTIPTIIITIISFSIINVNLTTTGNSDVSTLINSIDKTFHITPYLFIVPLVVVGLIILKTKPLIALGSGIILAAIFAYFFQSDVLHQISSSSSKSILNSIFTDTQINTDDEKLNKLFSAGGMKGMLGTIFLIICAMIFGGFMDAIGALAKITKELLKLAKSVFGLFASTVFSCIGINAIASDQYLAIVIPGKMFKNAYTDRGLAPENLSRTLEDSGTVTSVLIPWNTCGATQSRVLGVDVSEYFVYAIFNWLSPFMTLFFAAFSIKIKSMLIKESKE